MDALVPRTLAILEQDPLTEGDLYPGDLLVAVLRVPDSYWASHPAHIARVESILQSMKHPSDDIMSDIRTFRNVARS